MPLCVGRPRSSSFQIWKNTTSLGIVACPISKTCPPPRTSTPQLLPTHMWYATHTKYSSTMTMASVYHSTSDFVWHGALGHHWMHCLEPCSSCSSSEHHIPLCPVLRDMQNRDGGRNERGREYPSLKGLMPIGRWRRTLDGKVEVQESRTWLPGTLLRRRVYRRIDTTQSLTRQFQVWVIYVL